MAILLFDKDTESWDGTYWVRFAPNVKLRRYGMRGVGLLVARGPKDKENQWFQVDGQTANFLSLVTEHGHTQKELVGTGVVSYRMAFDIARSPEEAEEIKHRYAVAAQRLTPGTIARPAPMQRLSGKRRTILDAAIRGERLDAPLDTLPEFVPSALPADAGGPSADVPAPAAEPAAEPKLKPPAKRKAKASAAASPPAEKTGD